MGCATIEATGFVKLGFEQQQRVNSQNVKFECTRINYVNDVVEHFLIGCCRFWTGKMLKKHLNVTDKHHSNIVNYLNAKQCKQIIIFKKVGKSARQVTAVSFAHAKTNNHFLYPPNLRIKFYLRPCFSCLMLTCNKNHSVWKLVTTNTSTKSDSKLRQN